MDKNTLSQKDHVNRFLECLSSFVKNEITDVKINDGGGDAFYIFLKKINL